MPITKLNPTANPSSFLNTSSTKKSSPFQLRNGLSKGCDNKAN
jgi:hypothetical protein